MDQLPIKRLLLDSHIACEEGLYEFTIDCGAIYFGAVYNSDGDLTNVAQYFYTEACSRDDMQQSIGDKQLLSVDNRDYPVKSYLLTKNDADGTEWLRFHTIVPQSVDPDYFYQKYVGE
jgi:hypothetical protein